MISDDKREALQKILKADWIVWKTGKTKHAEDSVLEIVVLFKW